MAITIKHKAISFRLPNYLLEGLKTISFFLLLCLVSLDTTAQYVVYRNRPGITSNKTHLSFEGVPIDGLTNFFWDNMKKKGFSVKCEDDYCFNRYTTATIAENSDWKIVDISEGVDEKYVYGVNMYREYTRASTVHGCYEKMKEYIKEKYPITNTVLFIGDNSIDDKDTEVHYMIAGVGKIIVAYKFTNEESFVKVSFIDKENELTKAIQPVRNYYELTQSSGLYKKCTIETSYEEIKYYVNSDNNIYRFISRNDDRRQIDMLLRGNYDEKMKIMLINNYVLNGIEKCNNCKNIAIPVIENDFIKICNKYLVKTNEAKKRNTSAPVNFKDAVLDEISKWIFSPSERNVLNKVVPPEMIRQMIGGVLNFMGTSSDSHYTDYEKYINPYLHD